MKKTLIQGFGIIALFCLAWFALSQIDWVSIFKVEKITSKTEEKLGEMFWEAFKKTEKEIENPYVTSSVDSIVTKICAFNNIDKEFIKVHILEKDDVNAMALPNGHLIVYTGLILSSENQEELSGIICHEIAHIYLSHVMKKLIKEVGLSVLISMTTGNGGPEVIKETAKILSSSAFDRSLEKEADIKAVDFLMNAKINPEPFANFLYKLADQQSEVPEYWAWISTHPDSKERAEYLIEYIKDKKVKYKSVIAPSTWSGLQEQIK